jgi:hypothetical protein
MFRQQTRKPGSTLPVLMQQPSNPESRPMRSPRAKQSLTATLPELEPGVNELTVESSVSHAIHTLAVDQVLLSGGSACWVDPGTHAQSDPLVELAPSSRILDRIHIARGFTPFQHLELLRSLPGVCSDEMSLVVVPELDRYYRDDGLLADEGEDMLLSGLAALAKTARTYDVPVLVTRHRSDSFSQPIANAAVQQLACEATPFGPRFSTGDDETLVYPTDDGHWVQTTLTFWKQILDAREPLYDSSPAEHQHATGVTAHGAN